MANNYIIDGDGYTYVPWSNDDQNELIKRCLKSTQTRILSWKELLKLAAECLKESPDDEFIIWWKSDIRDSLQSDEKWLITLVKERTELKAFLGY